VALLEPVVMPLEQIAELPLSAELRLGTVSHYSLAESFEPSSYSIGANAPDFNSIAEARETL
jgi:hypothetical protein